MFFSANYMGVALFIGVCTALTNILFLLAMGGLAVAWNRVLKMNAAEEITEVGPFKVGKPGRMVGMYIASLLVFYYCGEDVVWKVFIYSVFFILLHAVFRNHTVEPAAGAGQQQQYVQTPQANPDFGPVNPPVAF